MSADDLSTAHVGQRRFLLAMRLAGRPGFCGCCLILAPKDMARVRRVFALTRQLGASVKKQRAARALRSD